MKRFTTLMQVCNASMLRAHLGTIVPLSIAKQDCRLLYTAGLSVRMRTYPATHRLHADMLRDVNRWVIDLVNEDA